LQFYGSTGHFISVCVGGGGDEQPAIQIQLEANKNIGHKSAEGFDFRPPAVKTVNAAAADVRFEFLGRRCSSAARHQPAATRWLADFQLRHKRGGWVGGRGGSGCCALLV